MHDIRACWVSLMDDRVILERRIVAVEDLAKVLVVCLERLQEEAAERDGDDEEESEEEM